MNKTTTAGAGGGAVLKRTATMRTMTDTEYYSVLDGCWKAQMPTGLVCAALNTTTVPVGTSNSGTFGSVCVTSGVDSNSENTARYGDKNVTTANCAFGTLREDMVLAGKVSVWARGQTFGGKKYVYVGQGCVVGWDPSNTVTLFG